MTKPELCVKVVIKVRRSEPVDEMNSNHRIYLVSPVRDSNAYCPFLGRKRYVVLHSIEGRICTEQE